MAQLDPVRVGLIGAAGRWGLRAHVPALQGVSEAKLLAVCTAHEETARAAADQFGVSRAYGSDNGLNADPEVEAVAVAVRVPAHYALTQDRKSTRLNSSHPSISYAVFCLKKKK